MPPSVGDVIKLFCEIPHGSRIGAREAIPIGAEGTIVHIFPLGLAFQVMFGDREVTVAPIEFTPH